MVKTNASNPTKERADLAQHKPTHHASTHHVTGHHVTDHHATGVETGAVVSASAPTSAPTSAPAIVIDEALVGRVGRLVHMRVNDQAMQTVLANLRGMIEAFAVLQEFRGEVLMEGASPVVTHPMPLRPDVVQPETTWLSPARIVADGEGADRGHAAVAAVANAVEGGEGRAQVDDARPALFHNAPHVVEQYFSVPKVVE